MSTDCVSRKWNISEIRRLDRWFLKFSWWKMKKLKNERPTWCLLLFYFTSYVLDMFRTLIYPSSGACDCVVKLPHRSSCSQFVVCWRFGAAGFWLVFVLQADAKRTPPNISRSKNSAAADIWWCSFCRLMQNEHHQISAAAKTPTHNELRTILPMW